MSATAIAANPEHCSKRSRIGPSPYMTVWSVEPALAAVNTLVYGELSQEEIMTDQLTAKDWLDQGLKTLAARRFTALKAEPLAKPMGGSPRRFSAHGCHLR